MTALRIGRLGRGLSAMIGHRLASSSTPATTLPSMSLSPTAAKSGGGTTPPPLHSFMVYAPDYGDEGALERRMSVRERHLTVARSLYAKETLKIGGALLSPDGLETDDPKSKMIGSMMVIRAESMEEARKKVEADIYWTAGVWDKERIVILPFIPAQLAD